MARIAILNAYAVAGDAVSNDMVAMRRLLAARGHDAALFAEYWELADPPVRHVRELATFLRGADDVLIYHMGAGWDAGLDLFRRLRCRKVLRYHNVTPAHFFEGHSDEYARNCRHGREQLKVFVAAGCDLFLSASAYNQRELLALGADPARCHVMPPCHDIDHLLSVAPDETVLDACGDGRTNLLFVGRVAPNKGHAILIEAFAAYRRHYDAASRLVLVGREDARLGGYSARLRERVREQGVDGSVVFAGPASDAALRAYYQTADVFVSASEHEGFCVPLVEAMALGVPVVAYGSTAVPDTVGTAGFVWPEADPYLLAGAAHRVVRDEEVRRTLRERGRRRVEAAFTPGRVEAAFWEAVRGVGA